MWDSVISVELNQLVFFSILGKRFQFTVWKTSQFVLTFFISCFSFVKILSTDLSHKKSKFVDICIYKMLHLWILKKKRLLFIWMKKIIDKFHRLSDCILKLNELKSRKYRNKQTKSLLIMTFNYLSGGWVNITI